MSKVTTKLQVTLPKALARQYGIRPGNDVRFEASGEVIRVVPPEIHSSGSSGPALGTDARLRLFDAATARQGVRDSTRTASAGTKRGWTREELYRRGHPSSD